MQYQCEARHQPNPLRARHRLRYRRCHSRATNLTSRHRWRGSAEDLCSHHRLKVDAPGLVVTISGSDHMWNMLAVSPQPPELWRWIATKVSQRNIMMLDLKCHDFIISSHRTVKVHQSEPTNPVRKKSLSSKKNQEIVRESRRIKKTKRLNE